MASVEFVDVDKTYPDGARALRALDLAVADGEMLVLVGPSGCGKSTTLRVLAGLEAVSAGEVRIGGGCVNGLSPQQRDVAMVFQNYALYPHMTVRGNLEFPLRMRRLSKARIRARVAQTADLLDLSELLQRRPGQLSGGQRQRVAMGRALVRQPRVFLMDEPLSNLDAGLRTRIRGEIARLQQSLGVTTLYVTHDQVEAMTLGERIAVLDAGRLQQVGPPQALYERPANTFVATFLGNPGMNIMPARVDRAQRTLLLAGGAWRIPLDLLPAGRRRSVERVGDDCLVGLRPEAFTPAAGLAADVVVDNAESLGHERLVYFRPPGVPARPPWVARLPVAQAAPVGERVRLGFDPGRLHLFDARGEAVA